MIVQKISEGLLSVVVLVAMKAFRKNVGGKTTVVPIMRIFMACKVKKISRLHVTNLQVK